MTTLKSQLACGQSTFFAGPPWCRCFFRDFTAWFCRRLVRSHLLHISQHFGTDMAGMHKFTIYKKDLQQNTNVTTSISFFIIHPGRLTWNLQITHLAGKMIFQTSLIMFHVNLRGCMHHKLISLLKSPAKVIDAEQRSTESSLTPGSLQWFLPLHLQAIHLGGATKHWFFDASSFKKKHIPNKQALSAYWKLVESWKSYKNGGMFHDNDLAIAQNESAMTMSVPWSAITTKNDHIGRSIWGA